MGETYKQRKLADVLSDLKQTVENDRTALEAEKTVYSKQKEGKLTTQADNAIGVLNMLGHRFEPGEQAMKRVKDGTYSPENAKSYIKLVVGLANTAALALNKIQPGRGEGYRHFADDLQKAKYVPLGQETQQLPAKRKTPAGA